MHASDLAEATDTVRDPVCGMRVKRGEEVAVINHRGKDYYFCSERCVRDFHANPSRYVPEEPAAEDHEGHADCCSHKHGAGGGKAPSLA